MPYKDLNVRREKQRDYQKKHYEANKEYYKKKSKERKKNIRKLLTDYKAEQSCSVCGENDPACLDLHHVNRHDKEINPSYIATLGWKIDKINRELKKCIVLCSNCHRKLHYYESCQKEKRSSVVEMELPF